MKTMILPDRLKSTTSPKQVSLGLLKKVSLRFPRSESPSAVVQSRQIFIVGGDGRRAVPTEMLDVDTGVLSTCEELSFHSGVNLVTAGRLHILEGRIVKSVAIPLPESAQADVESVSTKLVWKTRCGYGNVCLGFIQ